MTVLLPPPGPLLWLYPELGRFWSETGRSGDAADQVDLAACPCVVDLLADGAVREPLRIAAGPRGQALWRVLRQVDRSAAPAEFIDIPQLETALLEFATVRRPGHAVLPDGTWAPLDQVPEDRVGVFLLSPETALAEFSAVAGANPSAAVVPVFSTVATAAAAAVTRLPESWWGLLPGEEYPPALREGWRDLVRRWWPERYARFRGLENLALAGFDPYDEMLRGRYDTDTPRSAPAKPWVFAVDGIDGAGKSSQIEALREHLTAKGLRVAVHKIYRHGVFHETVTDVTRACAGDRNLHLWALQRYVKLFDSAKYFYRHIEPDLESCDVLIFDRYIQTHLAAGLGRYGHDPFARELLSIYPQADRVYLLDLPTVVALERIATRPELTVDENPYMLDRFRTSLLELIDREGLVQLDSTASMAANRDWIRNDVDRLMECGR